MKVRVAGYTTKPAMSSSPGGGVSQRSDGPIPVLLPQLQYILIPSSGDFVVKGLHASNALQRGGGPKRLQNQDITTLGMLLSWPCSWPGPDESRGFVCAPVGFWRGLWPLICTWYGMGL